MNFHILTLFPEMIQQGLNTSIIGRAAEKGLITLHPRNIRDYTLDKHGKVDDYTYGGGAGMLMQPQPVYDAWVAAAGECGGSGEKKIRTIYVTPQGEPFTQAKAEELASEEDLIFLCGHYEGIDERVLEEVVTDYLSIGDYVLTGGELAAMVMIDAISRLVPGVLNNDMSAETESFHNDLLEYPQYSRPEVWHGKRVPEVLLSGNHKKITEWRLEQSKLRTKNRRPDLYARYRERRELIKLLSRRKRSNIHMMELLSRGKGEILYAERDGEGKMTGQNILLRDRKSGACMLSAADREGGELLLEHMPEDADLFVTIQEFLNELLKERYGAEEQCCCYQACYTRREPLPVAYKDIRVLGEEHLEYILARYHLGSRDYIRSRLQEKAMYGAFAGDRLVGFIGMHDEGSMGMLFVEEDFRRQRIGESLEAFYINRLLSLGYIPYCHIYADNEVSFRLQEKLGLYLSQNKLWWLGCE